MNNSRLLSKKLSRLAMFPSVQLIIRLGSERLSQLWSWLTDCTALFNPAVITRHDNKVYNSYKWNEYTLFSTILCLCKSQMDKMVQCGETVSKHNVQVTISLQRSCQAFAETQIPLEKYNSRHIYSIVEALPYGI